MIKTKLFSTGNNELDSLLTEVYYSGIEDGYDYAQREFADDDEEENDDRPEIVHFVEDCVLHRNI